MKNSRLSLRNRLKIIFKNMFRVKNPDLLIEEGKKRNVKFIAFGGDGGTYDIGLQSLSGAMERYTDMVYVCYDNGAYMNTGTQRSSATPHLADTTTEPSGKISNGKIELKKDLTEIKESEQILFSKENGAEQPVFINEIQPKIKGVLVISEGAYDSIVKANLIKGVEIGLGLPSYKVTVLTSKTEVQR